MKTSFRKVVVISVVMLLACVAGSMLLPFVGIFRHEGHAETLQAPRQIRQITPEGLILENGALLKIPYVQSIPTNLPVLLAATQRGVEVEPSGQVIGLIKVWHWCGNDPVLSHLGRVDLTGLLLFAGATPTEPDLTNAVPRPERIDLEKWGLNISQYLDMKCLGRLAAGEFGPRRTRHKSQARPLAAKGTADENTEHHVGEKWLFVGTINAPNGPQHEQETFGNFCSWIENIGGLADMSTPKIALYDLWSGTSVKKLKRLTRSGGTSGSVRWASCPANIFWSRAAPPNCATSSPSWKRNSARPPSARTARNCRRCPTKNCPPNFSPAGATHRRRRREKVRRARVPSALRLISRG